MSTRNRVDIAKMLADKTAATQTNIDPAATAPSPTRARVGEPRSKSTTTSRASRPSDGAKWTQCEPHTFYVWPDSIDELQQLARRLQRARPKGEGERITMATLVRVAIARLLETGDDLAGVDEAELLDSYRTHTQPKKRVT